MTRKLPTLASLLLGAASAPAAVRALHPWSLVTLEAVTEYRPRQ
jgi:hypothetical protein